MNRVTLLGYVGKDPEVKAVPSGAKVANFSMATTESWVDKNTNQKVEKTEWHNLVAWRGIAELIEKYVRKGSRLMVEGKLETRSWDDRTTGQKRYMTEIVVQDLFLMGDPKGGAGPARNTEVAGQPAQAAPAGYRPPTEDELPF